MEQPQRESLLGVGQRRPGEDLFDVAEVPVGVLFRMFDANLRGPEAELHDLFDVQRDPRQPQRIDRGPHRRFVDARVQQGGERHVPGDPGGAVEVGDLHGRIVVPHGGGSNVK